MTGHERRAEQLVPRRIRGEEHDVVRDVVPRKRRARRHKFHLQKIARGGVLPRSHVVSGCGAHDDVCGLANGSLVHDLEHRGLEEVVGVEPRQELASSGIETRVARRSGARVVLLEHLDTRVLSGVLRQNPGRGVSGAVVDAYDFDVAKRLSDDAVHALPEMRLRVEDRDYDRDLGHCISFANRYHPISIRDHQSEGSNRCN